MSAPDLHNLFADLKPQTVWLPWKAVPKDGGKISKVPYNTKGVKANDRASDVTFDELRAFLAGTNGDYSGAGVHIPPGYWCLDLDGCVSFDKEGNGAIAPHAVKIVQSLPTYCELSPSKTGLHVWGKGAKPGKACRRDSVELYSGDDGLRFICVTGWHVAGTPTTIEPCDVSTVYEDMVSGALTEAKSEEQQAPRNTLAPASSVPIESAGTTFTNKYELFMKGTTTGDKPTTIADEAGNSITYADRSAADLAFATVAAIKHGDNPDAIWADYLDSCIFREEWGAREADFRRLTIANGIRSAAKLRPASPEKEVTPAADVFEDTYPEPMGTDAFQGVAGDFVRLVKPQTEADPVALLGNFLVAAGLLFSRNAFVVADGKRHHAVEYLLMAGDSGVGRKGTATNRVVPLMDEVAMFYQIRVLGGLSTGEGLVRALIPKGPEDGDSVRWFLAVIQEFASLLSVMKREGNTMSAILREAYDGGKLRVLTRKDPLSVDHVNLGVIAHITNEELLNNLTDTDRVNGFANRFLTICVKRWQLLPEGGDDVNLDSVVEKLKDAVEKSKGRGRIGRDADAKALWKKHYPLLTRKREGLRGALLSRAETHVLRLSLIYALLDGADAIRVEHLKAALAFWTYVENSVGHIYKNASGDTAADKILAAMADGPLTKTEIRRIFGDNKPTDWIDAKIQSLISRGLIIKTIKETGSGVRDAWRLKESV